MKNFKFFAATAALLACFAGAYGQTLEEVIASYKKAADLNKSNPAEAAKAFEATINMASKVGSTADEQRKQAQDAYATACLNIAKKSIQAKKYTQAYTELASASEAASKYNVADVKTSIASLLPNVELYAGVECYQGKKYDEAITYFDKVVERNKMPAQALYYKGLTLEKKGDDAGMIAAIQQAKTKAQSSSSESKWVANCDKKLCSYYMSKGVTAKQGGKLSNALQMFQSALQYDAGNSDLYLQLASVYNASEKWGDALNMANKGVALVEAEDGKYGFYYETGLALAGQGKAAEACASFKKVKSGNYLESAKYQIEQVLKCE